MVADSDADDIKFFMDEPFCPFNQVHHRQISMVYWYEGRQEDSITCLRGGAQRRGMSERVGGGGCDLDYQ
jgi:hypothetical protein